MNYLYTFENFIGWQEMQNMDFSMAVLGVKDEFMGNSRTRASYVNQMDCSDFGDYPIKIEYINNNWVAFTDEELKRITNEIGDRYEIKISDNTLPISVRIDGFCKLPERMYPNTEPIPYNPPKAYIDAFGIKNEQRQQIVIVKLKDAYYVAKYLHGQSAMDEKERFFKCKKTEGRQGLLSLLEFDPF